MLPSLLSAMALVRSRVYVVLVSRSDSKYTTTDFPRILYRGLFSRGGERKIALGSLTVTYSLKVMTIWVLCVGTLVLPGRGEMLVMTGGIVSLSPPLGGVVVLAQECENIIAPSTNATGIPGMSLSICLFILFYKSVRMTLCIPLILWSLTIILSRMSLSCTKRSM